VIRSADFRFTMAKPGMIVFLGETAKTGSEAG
jgi:hypothetical protein